MKKYIKCEWLLGFCIGMGLNTVVAGTIGRRETILYAMLMVISGLLFGNEVENNEE